MCGISQDLLLETFPIATIVCVLPDVPLIKNEINLQLNNQKFDEKKISEFTKNLYFLFHSIFAIVIAFLINFNIGVAWFVHVFFDLFTHSGYLSLRPFYPLIKWRFPWGKNILK